MRFFQNKPQPNLNDIRCPLSGLALAAIALSLEDEPERLALRLPYPVDAFASELEEALKPVLAGRTLHLEGALPAFGKPLGKVKNLIAIASGKGGVGKSTTTINLALALKELGLKVGVLDADLFGPSLPIMVGTRGQHPDSPDGKTMYPIEALGLYTQSIGYLVDDNDAAVWRGPMASTALMQLVNETHWPELDVLLIDMPPGTGDIQLTVSQKLPLTGAVIVTTPQDLALSDAIKGMAMFEKVNTPVLGLVENMSYHRCSQCGHHEPLFGDGGGVRLAEEKGVALLGTIPLTLNIRHHTDAGQPVVLSDPSGDDAHNYLQLARKLLGEMLKRPVPPAPIDVKMV